MKVLTKGVYYHKPKATGVTALWHDCKEWGKKSKKGRTKEARVPLNVTDKSEDTATYTCPCCGFEYKLDLHLVLIESLMT
jgi:hypothetical protein